MTLFSGCRRVSRQARGTRLATGKSRCAVLAGVTLAVDLVPHVSLSVCPSPSLPTCPTFTVLSKTNPGSLCLSVRLPLSRLVRHLQCFQRQTQVLSVCLPVSLSPDLSDIYSAFKDKPRFSLSVCPSPSLPTCPTFTVLSKTNPGSLCLSVRLPLFRLVRHLQCFQRQTQVTEQRN